MSLFSDDPAEWPQVEPSSTALTPFDYEGAQVRTVAEMDGEPWFVVADLCRAVGIREPAGPLSRVDPHDRRRLRRSDTPGFFGGIAPQVQELNVVNESGMYDLLLESRKPEARRFRRWLTSDVVPSLRRSGRYVVAAVTVPEPRLPKSYAEALRELASTVEERDAAREQVAVLEPAANAWTNLVDSTGDLSVGDAAKVLNRDPDISTGERRLFDTLLYDVEWCYRGGDKAIHAKQRHIDIGRLTERARYYHDRDGERVLATPQVRLTAKGLEALHRHLKGSAPLAIAPATPEVTR